MNRVLKGRASEENWPTRRDFLATGISAGAGLLLLGGCGVRGGAGGNGGNGDGAEYTIRLSHVQSADAAKGLTAERFKEEVEERSDGRITVEIYPNAQLYGDEDELQALESGSVEMIAPSPPSFANISPQVEVFELPFLFDTPEEVRELISPDTSAGQIVLENEELLDANMRILDPWPLGFRQLHSNTAIRTPDDLRGQRIRYSGGDVRLSTLEAWDTNPQSISSDEVYTSLQQGVIDGGENTFGIIVSNDWTEVQDYVTESSHGYTTYLLTINNEFFNSLPEDLQQAVTEASDEASAYSFEIIQQENEEARQAIQNSDTTEIIELSEEERQAFKEEVVPRIWNEYADVFGQDLIDELLAQEGT